MYLYARKPQPHTQTLYNGFRAAFGKGEPFWTYLALNVRKMRFALALLKHASLFSISKYTFSRQQNLCAVLTCKHKTHTYVCVYSWQKRFSVYLCFTFESGFAYKCIDWVNERNVSRGQDSFTRIWFLPHLTRNINTKICIFQQWFSELFFAH